jgi:two-component system chemotaxis response regulator CheB
VGHTYSPDSLLSDQGEAVEAAIWSAVNALQERAATYRRLGSSTIATASSFQERADLTERHANSLLNLLRWLIDDGEVG